MTIAPLDADTPDTTEAPVAHDTADGATEAPGLVARFEHALRGVLEPVWRDHRIGVAVGIGVAGMWGVVAA
jgi:hypothetical protein